METNRRLPLVDSNFSLSYIGSLKMDLMFVFNLASKTWESHKERKAKAISCYFRKMYPQKHVFSRIGSNFIIHLVQIEEKHIVGKSLLFKVV